MKKDARQIHLDPKEWRDAMRDIEAGSQGPAPAKTVADAVTSRTPAKRSGKKSKPPRAR